MDNKFFINTEQLKNDSSNNSNIINTVSINDNLVNDFLNKNVSLESLIEKEIYNTKF